MEEEKVLEMDGKGSSTVQSCTPTMLKMRMEGFALTYVYIFCHNLEDASSPNVGSAWADKPQFL